MNGFDLSTATDIKLGSTTVSAVYFGQNLIWPSNIHDYSADYLTFEAIDNGITFSHTITANTFYYSLDDGTTWTAIGTGENTPALSTGDKILWKCSSPTINPYSNGVGRFTSTGKFNASGNIMSLLHGDNFQNQTAITVNRTFEALFHQSSIVDASNLILPATTLKDRCYHDMFNGCTNMTAAPKELPATSLDSYCYQGMFYECSNLVSAPKELPATVFVGKYNCYDNMFGFCTSLEIAPELPDSSGGSYIYTYMFNTCTSLKYIKCLLTSPTTSKLRNWVQDITNTNGTFVKATGAGWPSGTSGIPAGWTVIEV